MQINGKPIRNIIFDLGGVILNIDYKRTEQAFIDLGFTNFNALYSQFHASDIFIQLETGKLSPPEFLSAIRRHASKPVSDRQITEAWNAMLLDFPQGRLTFLSKLKQVYRCFLLSNTNEIHYQAIQQHYKAVMEREVPLDDCFEKAYYSHDLGMRKPGVEIFKFLLEENRLDPAETLFIDDTAVNTQGAAAAGIHALFLPGNLKVEEVFEPSFSPGPYLISSKSI